MATVVQFRGGDTSQNNAFQGASKELTVDTQKNVVVVHDGSTTGGHPLMAEDGSNSALANGSVTDPALKFASGQTGIYSTGSNQVSITTGGTERVLFNSSGATSFSGMRTRLTDSTKGVELSNDGAVELWRNDSSAFIDFKTNTGEDYDCRIQQSNNGLAFSTGGQGTSQQRLFIDSAGNALVGTTSNALGKLTVKNDVDFSTGTSSNGDNIYLISDATSGNNVYGASIAFSRAQYADRKHAAIAAVQTSADEDHVGLAFFTHSSNDAAQPIVESLRIASDGKVGIGTTSPTEKLHVIGPSLLKGTVKVTPATGSTEGGEIQLFNPDALTIGTTLDVSSANAFRIFQLNDNSIMELGQLAGTGGIIKFATSGTERVQIDSAGRLLVGTSSTQADTYLVVEGQSGAATGPGTITLARGSNTPGDGNGIGQIFFTDTDHTTDQSSPKSAASITAQRDGGTWTSGTSMPTRLVFSTTANSAAAPTTRMTIKSDGRINMDSIPAFPNDAAADAAAQANPPTLQSGDLYTVSRVLKVLP